MRYFFTIFFLTSTIFLRAQPARFRTDGYYFYDNKCDTIYVSKINKEIKTMLKGAKYPTNGDECVPKGTVSLDGSSNFEFIGFSGSGKGFHFSENCTNIKEIKEGINSFKEGYKGTFLNTLAERAITRIAINKDNTFTANFGQSEHSFKKITGKIFPDRIELRFIYPPQFPMYDHNKLKVFRFYKYGQLPPLRQKFIIKYKAVPYN